VATTDQMKRPKTIGLSESSQPASLSLGPYLLSAFFAVLNILVASLKIYSYRVVLYWLVSPSLLLLAAFVITRALYVQKEILQARNLISVQPDAEAREACMSLAKSLAVNFAFGMYGIAAAMVLVSWIASSHK
jgi:hypothetical protein